MTLKQVLESGKPFKRKGSKSSWIIYDPKKHNGWFYYINDGTKWGSTSLELYYEDLVADDWEVKTKPIYFVTVFYLEPNKDTYKRIRCWGWFEKEEDAEKCIKENWTDIYEIGYYNTAMIESLGEGTLSIFPKNNRWFDVKFIDQNTYEVNEIDVPDRFKQMCRFSYV